MINARSHARDLNFTFCHHIRCKDTTIFLNSDLDKMYIILVTLTLYVIYRAMKKLSNHTQTSTRCFVFNDVFLVTEIRILEYIFKHILFYHILYDLILHFYCIIIKRVRVTIYSYVP